MIKILFICHGNICRSTMAQFVMQHLVHKSGQEDNFLIDSKATSTEELGNGPHYGTVRKMQEMNIPMVPHRAEQMQRKDYRNYDYIIGMDQWNYRNIMRIIGKDPENKVSLLLDWTEHPRDIADPWYTGNFDQTYEDVLEGCEALLQELQSNCEEGYMAVCCSLKQTAFLWKSSLKNTPISCMMYIHRLLCPSCANVHYNSTMN